MYHKSTYFFKQNQSFMLAEHKQNKQQLENTIGGKRANVIV